MSSDTLFIPIGMRTGSTTVKVTVTLTILLATDLLFMSEGLIPTLMRIFLSFMYTMWGSELTLLSLTCELTGRRPDWSAVFMTWDSVYLTV
ncbi:MAG: hypothetical protein M1826_002033 [Phylliscum demangeonii]|nr:MAG: hypothetical protein M1826_002033 [Phylliscum demangeonii]